MRTWLLITYKVPAEPSRMRVSLWRKLKELGAVYIQQGAAVLPMTEALLAVCEEIHRELRLRLVAAITHLVNEPARQVLERIGFAAVALDGEHEVVYAWKPGGWPMVAGPAPTAD